MEQIKSYAKVNLCLLVGKKKNNLHKIKSIFCLYKNLYDEININSATKNKVTYINKNNQEIKIKDCIVTKSLQFLKDNFNIDTCYEIKIKKNIPFGTGLGGGSSNAGTIIRYIAQENKLPIKELINKSLLIGSDVPFFVSNYEIALVKGFGESVRKLKIKVPEFRVQLNEENCSTKLVYNTFDNLKKEHSFLWLQRYFLRKKKYDKLHNDLEKPCFMEYKKLYNIREKLLESYDIKLSGSGSSFILFNKKEK